MNVSPICMERYILKGAYHMLQGDQSPEVQAYIKQLKLDLNVLRGRVTFVCSGQRRAEIIYGAYRRLYHARVDSHVTPQQIGTTDREWQKLLSRARGLMVG